MNLSLWVFGGTLELGYVAQYMILYIPVGHSSFKNDIGMSALMQKLCVIR